MIDKIDEIKRHWEEMKRYPNGDTGYAFAVSDIAWLIEENLQLKEKVRDLVNNDTAMSTTMNKYVDENKQLQSQVEKYKKVVEAAQYCFNECGPHIYELIRLGNEAFDSLEKAIANLEEIEVDNEKEKEDQNNDNAR